MMWDDVWGTWHWRFMVGWGKNLDRDTYDIDVGFYTIHIDILAWRQLWTWGRKSNAMSSNPNVPNGSTSTSSLLTPAFLQSLNQSWLQNLGNLSPFSKNPLSGLGGQGFIRHWVDETWKPATIKGPVIGYRAFDCSLEDGEYRLHSCVVNCVWDGPVMQDQCPVGDAPAVLGVHDVRTEGIGFHAVRELSSKTLALYAHRHPKEWLLEIDGEQQLVMAYCSVLAQVECFGSIVEHEDGWRSQGQSIQRLYVPCQDVVKDLEQRYQCEVEVRPELFPWNQSQEHLPKYTFSMTPPLLLTPPPGTVTWPSQNPPA